MVKGLPKFEEYFSKYSDNYILIGGAACDIHIEDEGLTFRATKDLDIVLIVEAVTPKFVEKFWEFIKEGDYGGKQKSEGDKKYYRFTAPEKKDFPYQLELFSRNPDLDLEGDSHLTPIPIDENISSLSAILLNDDYYKFIINNSNIKDGVHIADTTALICLKARAFLDMNKLKEEGGKVDSDDIKKHRLDIIRLAAVLRDEDIDYLSPSIAADLSQVIFDIRKDPPDGKVIGKHMGVGVLDIEEAMIQLEKTFHI